MLACVEAFFQALVKDRWVDVWPLIRGLISIHTYIHEELLNQILTKGHFNYVWRGKRKMLTSSAL